MKTRSTFLCILFFVSISVTTTAYTQAVNVQDSLALVDLYIGNNGTQWTYNDNWLTGPVSTWYGVTVTDTRVTELNLNSNNLTGTIPSSIGNLTNLAWLLLGDDQLSGSIPTSIGNLANLYSLNLGDNQLSGEIPSSLGNLANLSFLELRLNQLSGSIPSSLGNLVNLTFLNLYGNQLSGEIPSALGNLINLGYLYLSENQFSGSIPSFIGNLTSLASLGLYHNQFSGSIPSFLGNLNLFALDLSHNQLSGNIPSFLGNLGNLTDLNLSFNQLNGEIPSSLGNLANLNFLRLNDNHLSGGIPPSLGNLVQLYILDLSNAQLSGGIPPSLGNLVNLNNLILSFNHFTFDGMESIAQTFPFAVYDHQANIPIHQTVNGLFVSTGGTLNNNTYKWFNLENTDSVIIVGDSVFHPAVSGNYYAVATNSVCTQLTLYSDTIFYDVTLPVTIVNLRAQNQKNIIRIEWTSLTEVNVERYEIQRSSNPNDFISIESISAKANETQRADYGFDDLKPLSGNNYYRLKVFDNDREITYSNIVLVNVRKEKAITLIYPVPAKNILHIETSSNTSFSIVDQSGRILLTTNINGKGTVNISHLSAGFYFLKNNDFGTAEKIIIVR